MKGIMIATEKFDLIDEEGVHIPLELRLRKSACFDYGNGTCLGVFEDGMLMNVYDTRYEKFCNTPEKFHDWSLEFVKGYVRPRVRIERIDESASE